MADKHAKFSPSSAHRWMNCWGALVMEGSSPAKATTFYQAEGTAAHTLAAVCLDFETEPQDSIGKTMLVEGHKIEVTAEFADYVAEYTDFVRALRDTGYTLYVEVAVPLDHMTNEEGAEGTSDAVLINLQTKHMICVDFKFGQGERVDAAENDQERMYLSGAFRKLVQSPYTLDSVDMALWRFTNIIYQPRINNVSEEEITGQELWYFEADVEAAVMMNNKAASPALDIADFLRPGEKQCKWCSAKAKCPALRNVVNEFVRDIDPASPADFENLSANNITHAVAKVKDLDGKTLSNLYRVLPMINLLTTSVMHRIEELLWNGEEVGELYLTPGKLGNRKWISEAEYLRIAKGWLGKNKMQLAYSEPKPLTAPAAEKAFAKKDPTLWELLQTNITRTEGNPTIAVKGSGEPIYQITPVADGFDVIETSQHPQTGYLPEDER